MGGGTARYLYVQLIRLVFWRTITVCCKWRALWAIVRSFLVCRFSVIFRILGLTKELSLRSTGYSSSLYLNFRFVLMWSLSKRRRASTESSNKAYTIWLESDDDVNKKDICFTKSSQQDCTKEDNSSALLLNLLGILIFNRLLMIYTPSCGVDKPHTRTSSPT